VTSAKLAWVRSMRQPWASNSVTTVKLAANAVDGTKISSGAVGTTQLAASAVDSTKLASGAVNTAALASGAVDSTKLASGAVTTPPLPRVLLAVHSWRMAQSSGPRSALARLPRTSYRSLRTFCSKQVRKAVRYVFHSE
jgi:hypothetical protein